MKNELNQCEPKEQDPKNDDEIENDLENLGNQEQNAPQIKKPSGVECCFATLAAGSTFTKSNKYSLHIKKVKIGK